jgi:hypothetical protein
MAKSKRPAKANSFLSGLERRIFAELEKHDIKVRYEPDRFVYKKRTTMTFCNTCGTKDTYKLARYTPDFRIGKNIYIETKGRFTSSNRSAMVDFLRSHPDFDLRFLFGADNFLTANHRTRYSDWCDSIGVKYAIKEIPKEWIDDARKQLAGGREPL